MLQPTPGNENRKQSVIEAVTFLLRALPAVLIATGTGGAIGSAMFFDAAERQRMAELGYDDLVWPLRSFYRVMNSYADFIDSYWPSLLLAGVIVLMWWVFAYIRWGSFLPRQQRH